MRLALAGFAVGINVVEAADIGAIFSLFVAAFALFQSFAEDGTTMKKIGPAVGRITVIAAFAVFRLQAVISLVGARFKASSAPDKARKTRRPIGTRPLSGVFPKSKRLGSLYRAYLAIGWTLPMAETIGAGWDVIRHGTAILIAVNRVRHGLQLFIVGTGNYAGILVILVACGHRPIVATKGFCIFRHSPAISLVLDGGLPGLGCSHLAGSRPFMPFFINLPYFSTIRNPMKFLFVFSWAIVIVFAYGIHGLSRRYLEIPATGSASPWAT